MANVHDYDCDLCGERIGESATPILVYVVTGQVPNTGEPVDMNQVPAPALVRELMAQPIARREFCLACFAKTIGQPLEAVAPAPDAGPLAAADESS